MAASKRPPPAQLATASGREAPLVEAMPLALLDEPLEYIFADHFRQRAICAALRRFAAERRASRAEADQAVAFLTQDLFLHRQDEDDDLFPAVRRRALPEDDLGAVLARLDDDHRRAESTVAAIVKALAGRPADDPVRITAGTAELLNAYAAAESRHLAIENGVILAIARLRLNRRDVAAIGRKMKQRRGACPA